MSHFHDCINTIYQFIKPFLENKMSIFEEYGAFNFFFTLAHSSINKLIYIILKCVHVIGVCSDSAGPDQPTKLCGLIKTFSVDL